jgi:hypothetical protein
VAAEVNARNGKEPAASKALESALSDCVRDGYKEFEFEARLDLGRLELRFSRASGRQRLEKLEEDAGRKDFRLIARKAREELDRDLRQQHAASESHSTLSLNSSSARAH